jgi:chaperonin GroEL
MQRSGDQSIHRTRKERVVFQPATHRALQRGIRQIAQAIRPTLGPRPRVVAIDRILDERMPELLDDGGTIAKRIIQLPDRDADVGAMLARDCLGRVDDQVGDGTATAAVLLQSIYDEGVRYLAADGNAMRLQASLQEGMHVVLDHLSESALPMTGKEELAQVAETVCHDPPLAELLGEIFDIIGEYGRLEVRAGHGRGLRREYVEGMYWEQGLISRRLVTDKQRLRTEFEDAAILISDLKIDDPRQLYPALEVALRAEVGSLMIVTRELSDRAIAFLLTNRDPDRFQAAAVKAPGWDPESRAAALEDLAVLTGGRVFTTTAGETFDKMGPDDFGRARRVWADMQQFGIVGGKGDPHALREHIATLRRAFSRTEEPAKRERLRERIGKLMGGSATLWVGGATELEVERRVELAKRTAAAMRGAIAQGVVPGGGTALLACRPALRQRLEACTNGDARAAYRVLLRAMEEPFRAIVGNAGFEASPVMARIGLNGPVDGFDVVSGEMVDMAEAGIYDAVVTLKTAVYAAISTAAQALTIDVLIHRPGQPKRAPTHTPGKLKDL